MSVSSVEAEVPPEMSERTACPDREGGPHSDQESGVRLDGDADVVEDRGDLAAQEKQGDDGDDRDEGEDQRVFGETLAFLVTME